VRNNDNLEDYLFYFMLHSRGSIIMNTNKWIVIAGIAGITIMEVVALLKGINGALLTTVIAVVAGLVGWSAPQLKLQKDI